MQTVNSLLSTQSKLIKSLLNLKSELNKKNTRLTKERILIEKQQTKLSLENKRADAAVNYLDGLFEAVRNADTSENS